MLSFSTNACSAIMFYFVSFCNIAKYFKFKSEMYSLLATLCARQYSCMWMKISFLFVCLGPNSQGAFIEMSKHFHPISVTISMHVREEVVLFNQNKVLLCLKITVLPFSKRSDKWNKSREILDTFEHLDNNGFYFFMPSVKSITNQNKTKCNVT